MKGITVKQPWAWAIARGGKSVENRSSGTSYRGPLLIHAGKAWSERGAADERVAHVWGGWLDLGTPCHPMRYPELLPEGAVIAVAELVDVHPDGGCCRPWGESTYLDAVKGRVVNVVHYLLEDVRALDKPLPYRGALGLWTPDADLIEAVMAVAR